MSKRNDEELEQMELGLNHMEIQPKIDHNESVPINRLPVELFCMILDHLGRDDLFTYESVCKKWCSYIKTAVNQRLVIAKRPKLQPRHWFFSNTLYPPRSVMVVDTLDVQLIESSFMFSLKQLKICDPRVEADKYLETDPLVQRVEFLNQLVNLEVLEVSKISCDYDYDNGDYDDNDDYGDYSEKTEQLTLRLPHLKHLAIHYQHYFDLLLDCPKLVAFKTKTVGYYYAENNLPVDFLHPLSITHLFLDQYSNYPNFEKLTNLEHLSVSGFDTENEEVLKEYAKKIFEKFPNLNAISLRPDKSSYRMAREAFVHLLKERTALRREQVILNFYGIRIDEEAQLERQPEANGKSYGEFLRFLSGLYMKNHSQLSASELKWVRELDYSGLFDNPSEYVQKDREKVLLELARKLDRVEVIRVSSEVLDEDHLIAFIGQFKHFNSLKVGKEAVQLGELFYRKLAATCSNAYLMIEMDPGNGFNNFDFAFQFKNLVGLRLLYYDANDEFVRLLFDHFDVFQFEHNVKRDRVRITKRSRTRFEFSVHSGHCEVFDNLDQLLRKVNKYCRENYGKYHSCDCGCGDCYCPDDSYSYNLHKDNFSGTEFFDFA